MKRKYSLLSLTVGILLALCCRSILHFLGDYVAEKEYVTSVNEFRDQENLYKRVQTTFNKNNPNSSELAPTVLFRLHEIEMEGMRLNPESDVDVLDVDSVKALYKKL